MQILKQEDNLDIKTIKGRVEWMKLIEKQNKIQNKINNNFSPKLTKVSKNSKNKKEVEVKHAIIEKELLETSEEAMEEIIRKRKSEDGFRG